MSEVIAWKNRAWSRKGKWLSGSEISNIHGIFRSARAALTYTTEDPAVYCMGDAIPLKRVKYATPKQKERYVDLMLQLRRVRRQLKDAERDIVEYGMPVTWEWILEHGKPREKIPVPHHSRKALATLRKGSKVVIAVQSSAYYEIAGRVGKILKKTTKFVHVDFGRYGIYKIPYRDLKPAAQVSRKKRKEAKEGSKIAAEIVGTFNKTMGSA